MKRIVLLLVLLLPAVAVRAQRVRNKPLDITLANIKSDEVIPLFGKPVQVDSNGIDGSLIIEYPHATFVYCETWDPEHEERGPEYAWDGFSTDSPDFCILSDCFPGGIRVGDRIERIRKLDIVHSKPGKGREENGLKKMAWKTENEHYLILGEEFDHFYLEVKDSVIVSIDWSTPEDWVWAQGGVLWRIEAESLPAPSYILGTFPNAPADVCRRIAGLDEAWKSVKTVWREDPDLGPWGKTIPGSMYLPDGKELSGLYELEEYADIQDYVKQVTGFRPEELWWTPNGLTRHLRHCLLEQAMPTGGKDDMAAFLYKKAVAEGKEVHTLPPMFPWVDWESRDKQAHDWNLLRLVWYPEGEPDHAKDWIRSVYEAYLMQDMDEIGWRLFRGPTSPINAGMAWWVNGGWSDELEKAVRNGPTLIIVDVSRLVSWDGMRSMLGEQDWFWIRSVKPVKD